MDGLEPDSAQAGQSGQGGLCLVVILPALNEERTVGEVIAHIPRDIPGVGQTKVIVVDDGSTDATAEVARQAGAKVVRHRRNLGVGASFRTGIAAALAAGADAIVNMDADGQFDPADIPALLEPVLAREADMTTCTRFARPDYVPDMPAVKKWGNRMMCRLINRICWNAGYTDVSCGFRAYSRYAATRLTLFGDFTYTQESFIDMLGKGMHIVEVPLRVRGVRQHGTSRVAGNLWRYAVQSSAIIFRAARDVRPLAFFGSISAVLFVLGIVCGLVVFIWWATTGHTTPFRSLVTGGAAFLILGFLMLILALVADMLGRQRVLLEQLLADRRMERRRPGGDGEEAGGESGNDGDEGKPR